MEIGDILNEVQKEFDREYKKLRKCNRDSAFYKLQGGLEKLEWVLNLPAIIENRGELNKPTK